MSSYVQEHFNSGAPVVYSERRIILGPFLEQWGSPAVDVLKIDTDGHDVRVLRGCQEYFTRSPPLLAIIECSFNGFPEKDDSILATVDAILRPMGLSMIDMNLWRYSRRQLPGQFLYGIPAQTATGPVAWADVAYADDPLSIPGKLDRWLSEGRLQRCLKLIVLYEMLALPDCAAELICKLRDHPLSAEAADWNSLLDALVPDNPWGATNYADFIGGFQASPLMLLPQSAE